MLAALFSPAPAAASGAATAFTVTGFDDGSGSCGTADANGRVACTTLRAAINAANLQSNGPTIELQAGTYQLTAGNGGQLDLGSSMNIIGAGPGGPSGTTIRQTDGQNRVLEVDGTSVLSGLEITGGHWSPAWSSGRADYGGGILVLGVLNLQNAAVTGNEVVGAAGPTAGDAGNGAEGGGIAYASSAPSGSLIGNSTISGNQALGGAGATGGQPGGDGVGGGIVDDTPGTLSIDHSTVSGNVATGGAGGSGASAGGTGGSGEGGGIYTGYGGLYNSSRLSVIATTLASNTASGGDQGAGPASGSHSGGSGLGGGIGGLGGTDRIVNSTVFDNTAQAGASSPGSGTSTGSGGGLYGSDVDLESDTIDANRASSSTGNVWVNATALNPIDIVDTVIAGGSPDNCDIMGGSPNSSLAYDLEDDPAGSCGFSASAHDLVGANPLLPTTLASNGGPTQTLAPAPESPVLGSGGACQSTDQRGLPRPTPCDIGSFQSQAPTNTSRPVISGVPARGHRLSCTLGTWTGDGQLSFAFQWLRDGVVIPGANATTYLIPARDAGHALACRVTATYYGSTPATSALAPVLPNPVVSLLRVTVAGTSVVVSLGCGGASGQRCLGVVELKAYERVRRHKVIAVLVRKPSIHFRTATVGRRSYAIGARSVATLRVRLGARALALLRSFAHLPLTLIVTQALPSGPRTIDTSRLVVPPVQRRR